MVSKLTTASLGSEARLGPKLRIDSARRFSHWICSELSLYNHQNEWKHTKSVNPRIDRRWFLSRQFSLNPTTVLPISNLSINVAVAINNNRSCNPKLVSPTVAIKCYQADVTCMAIEFYRICVQNNFVSPYIKVKHSIFTLWKQHVFYIQAVLVVEDDSWCIDLIE